MVSYQCKGRARKFETFAEVFRTGLILVGSRLRPTQLFCFVHIITGTRFNWSREKRRGTFQKVLNSPGFILLVFFSPEFSSMRRDFCKPKRDVADTVGKKLMKVVEKGEWCISLWATSWHWNLGHWSLNPRLLDCHREQKCPPAETDTDGTENFPLPKFPVAQTSFSTDPCISLYCSLHFKYTLKANLISLI